MAIRSDNLVISLFTDTQNTNASGEEKKKRTNTDLGQLQALEGGIPWHILCILWPNASVHSSKTPTKATSHAEFCWLHSFSFSWLLSLADWSLLLPSGDCLLLSSPGPSFPLPSGFVGDLMHSPFVWVSCQSRQRYFLTGTHTPTQWMPNLVSQGTPLIFF